MKKSATEAPQRGNSTQGTGKLTQPTQLPATQSVTLGDTGQKANGSEARDRELLTVICLLGDLNLN